MDQHTRILDSGGNPAGEGLPVVWTLCWGLILMAGAVVVGFYYWMQFKSLAKSVEENTRKNQSDYDLVSRDIIKLKQDVTAPPQGVRSANH